MREHGRLFAFFSDQKSSHSKPRKRKKRTTADGRAFYAVRDECADEKEDRGLEENSTMKKESGLPRDGGEKRKTQRLHGTTMQNHCDNSLGVPKGI